MAPRLGFEKFAQEAHEYINFLAEQLGHPEEKERALILWRAVMHSVRDRIHIGESFQIMAPLPMIFKGIYAEDWKFSEKPPKSYDTMEGMENDVQRIQRQYGETEFSWGKPTSELIAITLSSLTRYMPESQLEHIREQLPKEIHEMVS